MAQNSHSSTGYGEQSPFENIQMPNFGYTPSPVPQTNSINFHQRLHEYQESRNSDAGDLIQQSSVLDHAMSLYSPLSQQSNTSPSLPQPASATPQQPLHSVGFGSAQRTNFVSSCGSTLKILADKSAYRRTTGFMMHI